MGTHADFWMGRNPKTMRWLGSCAYDGHAYEKNTAQASKARTGAQFLAAVECLISDDDGTRPQDGWPWPWETSRTTDHAYAFDRGQVWVCLFGGRWRKAWPVPKLDPDSETAWDDWWGDSDDDNAARFPKMSTASMAGAGSPRSGVMLLSVPRALNGTDEGQEP